MQEYNIHCEFDMNLGEICVKDNAQIDFKSSHLQRAPFYVSYEKTYQLDNGDRLIIRVLGVLGLIFNMNEGYWWEVLN